MNMATATSHQTHLNFVNGMGMIEGAFCPHYQKEERKSFDIVCKKQNLPAIGCADQCAYVVTDEKIFPRVKNLFFYQIFG